MGSGRGVWGLGSRNCGGIARNGHAFPCGRMVDAKGRTVDPMSLNIKNEKTHRLAQELARATGESMTVAGSEAIRERLGRVRGKSKKSIAGKLMNVGRRSGPTWN